jgi:hypothetical protein
MNNKRKMKKINKKIKWEKKKKERSFGETCGHRATLCPAPSCHSLGKGNSWVMPSYLTLGQL